MRRVLIYLSILLCITILSIYIFYGSVLIYSQINIVAFIAIYAFALAVLLLTNRLWLKFQRKSLELTTALIPVIIVFWYATFSLYELPFARCFFPYEENKLANGAICSSYNDDYIVALEVFQKQVGLIEYLYYDDSDYERIYWTDISGKIKHPIISGTYFAEKLGEVKPNPGKNLLIFSNKHYLLIYDLDARKFILKEPVKDLTDYGWAPSGERYYFSTNSTGYRIKDLSNHDVDIGLPSLRNATILDWSKDGKQLIYSDYYKTYIYDIEHKRSTLILPYNIDRAQFSGTGQKIVYRKSQNEDVIRVLNLNTKKIDIFNYLSCYSPFFVRDNQLLALTSSGLPYTINLVSKHKTRITLPPFALWYYNSNSGKMLLETDDLHDNYVLMDAKKVLKP